MEGFSEVQPQPQHIQISVDPTHTTTLFNMTNPQGSVGLRRLDSTDQNTQTSNPVPVRLTSSTPEVEIQDFENAVEKSALSMEPTLSVE